METKRKHVSEETRQKLSKAKKGQIPWNKGKHQSEEHKQKIHEAKIKRTKMIRERTTKKCIHCKQIKPIADFRKRKQTVGGRKYELWGPYCLECGRTISKEYRKNNPEEKRKAVNKWANNNSEKALKIKLNWAKNNPEKIKESIKKWCRSEKGKIATRKYRARRRNYGYNMLNTYFPDSVGHHINDVDVVFIPRNIHLTCGGTINKELHRKKVFDFYGNIENMINNLIIKEDFFHDRC